MSGLSGRGTRGGGAGREPELKPESPTTAILALPLPAAPQHGPTRPREVRNVNWEERLGPAGAH